MTSPPTPGTTDPQSRGRVKRNRVIAAALGGGFAVLASAVLLFSFSGSGSDPVLAPTPPAGEPAPTSHFEMFDGSQATLSDYEGRPLVVNFWASWCPSCVAELSAAIVPVQERFGDEVAFLGVNNQDDRGRALELVAETGVRFDLADDPGGDLFTELEGIGMPFTVIIAADGSIVERHNGPLDERQLEAKIVEHLAAAGGIAPGSES